MFVGAALDEENSAGTWLETTDLWFCGKVVNYRRIYFILLLFCYCSSWPNRRNQQGLKACTNIPDQVDWFTIKLSNSGPLSALTMKKFKKLLFACTSLALEHVYLITKMLKIVKIYYSISLTQCEYNNEKKLYYRLSYLSVMKNNCCILLLILAVCFYPFALIQKHV